MDTNTSEAKASLPHQLMARLRPGEVVRYFNSENGRDGQAPSPPGGRWLLITNQRILFGGSGRAAPGASTQHQSCSIPLADLSGLVVSTGADGAASAAGEAPGLRLTGGGVQAVLALASVEEALRLQGLLESLRPERRPQVPASI